MPCILIVLPSPSALLSQVLSLSLCVETAMIQLVVVELVVSVLGVCSDLWLMDVSQGSCSVSDRT